jgi:hypothetical protein
MPVSIGVLDGCTATTGSSVDGTALSTRAIASSSDATAYPPDPGASSGDAGATTPRRRRPPEEGAFVVLPIATPILQHRRVLYPTAKRFTVEGTAFVLVAMDAVRSSTP